MKTRIMLILCAGLIALSAAAVPARAADDAKDKDKDKGKKEETKKADKKVDAKKIKASSAFLNRWKKIQTVTKKRAYETQQTRTVAGPSRSPAETQMLESVRASS